MIPRTSVKRRIDRALRGSDEAADSSDGHRGTLSVSASSAAPRGTVRQRINRALESEHVDREDLPLNDKLKKMWASGQLPASEIQELADVAERQGAGGLSRLAASGSHGSWPQNVQRSLISFFGHPVGLPSFSWIRLPTSKGDVLHPVIMPHLCLDASSSSSQLCGRSGSGVLQGLRSNFGRRCRQRRSSRSILA